MSFKFDGTSTARISRTSGNVSNTNAMTTCLWVKRTANFSGLKHLFTYRSSGDSDGHDLVCNDPSYAAYAFNLQANYATAQAVGDDPLALNTWTFVAMVGSGGNISLKYWDGAAIITETVGQTSFVPAALRIGDAGAGTTNFTGLMAHIRTWNSALSDADLEAEKNSATAVKASPVSAHSGNTNISTALAGETGTAFSNAGAVTYDADTPSFSSFTGVVVSGDSDMPYAVVEAVGSRFNRLLYSADLSNAVWSKQTNELATAAVAAPAGSGTSQRILIKVNTGGIYQLMSGLPSGISVAIMAARKVDTDYVALRHMLEGFGSGAQGIFNLTNGTWVTQSNFGTVTDGAWGSRSLGGGWYLIWIAMTATGKRILEFYPVSDSSQQIPAVGKYLDVASFQYEDAVAGDIKATYHKPTGASVVVRALTSVSVALAASTIGDTQTTTATAQLLDDASAPWDQYGPVTFASGTTATATVPATTGLKTDLSGRMAVTVTAVANGTTSITATANSITSSGKTLTVGTAIARFVEILFEGGYEGTTGWAVGVYQNPSGTRFPNTYLFEAIDQTVDVSLSSGQSRMVVPVPSAVSVSAAQVVEVAIENDNLAGKAQDGPGIFPAVVI